MIMALNFQIEHDNNLDPVSQAELKKAIDEEMMEQRKKAVAARRRIQASDAQFISDMETKRRKRKKQGKKAKAASKDTAERERQQRNIRTRKYTKEMQNREAIEEQSKKLQQIALQTDLTTDDDFADSASRVSRKFDDIVYNSPTTAEAVEDLDDMFDHIHSKCMRYM